MQNILDYVLSKQFCLGRVLLMILCMIHEKTKFHTARTIKEVFYWPNGFCLDTVIVIAFFTVVTYCIYCDCIFYGGHKRWRRLKLKKLLRKLRRLSI